MPRRKKHPEVTENNKTKKNGIQRKEPNNSLDPKIKNAFVLLEKLLDSSQSKKLLQHSMKVSLEEDNLTRSSILKRISNSHKNAVERIQFEDSRLDSGDELDIELLDDDDFSIHFHMTRKTLKFVLRDVKDIPKEVDICTNEVAMRVPIETAVILCLWYLRNDKKDIAEGMKLFRLRSIEVFDAVLERGLRFICILKPFCGLTWPKEEEFPETSRVIFERFKLEDIVGVIYHVVFVTERKERLLLQVIVNEKCMFKAAEVSFNTTTRGALNTANLLMEKINHLPEKYACLGGQDYSSDYPPALARRLITPFPNIDSTNMNNEEGIFNNVVELSLNLASEALNEVVRRFPRLTKLHRPLPEAIVAACALHNYCIKYHDLAPYY